MQDATNDRCGDVGCATRYPRFTGDEPCAQIGDHMYFWDGPPAGLQHVLTACDGCPMLAPCRDWAVAHEEFGLWGGLFASARAVLRRELGVRLHQPPASMAKPRSVLDETA